MGFLTVLQQMGMIAFLVAIGFLTGKRKIVDSVSSKSISTIVVDICNPAMMLTSVLDGSITAGHDELITAGAIAVIFYAVMVLIGFVLPKLLRVETDKQRFYNMMCVYTNVGFIGIPVAHAILPPDGMLCVLVCNVMYSLLFYTHGVAVLSGNKEKIRPSQILSPGTIAAIISILIVWFRISLPEVINETISYVGNATVFLSMLLLGVSIARSGLLEGLKSVKLWLFILIRMIALPTVLAVILKSLNIDPVITAGMCLMATMPVGNLPLIQAEKTGEDTTILSRAIAVTTVVSMITITVFMSILA
ncbi:MAG: AEC family transporter, partial [Eubacterium sp.]|nr:AEC family transporter [Eubacterium sp.]